MCFPLMIDIYFKLFFSGYLFQLPFLCISEDS